MELKGEFKSNYASRTSKAQIVLKRNRAKMGGYVVSLLKVELARIAVIFMVSIVFSGCSSHANNNVRVDQQRIEASPSEQQSAEPSTGDFRASAISEDDNKGRCDDSRYDYDGQYTSVRLCEKGDLEAGSCQWYGDSTRIDKCALPGDTMPIGRFAFTLRSISGGQVAEMEDVQGVFADVDVLIYDEDEAHRWLQHHGDATLSQGLRMWAMVFHRNHPSLHNAKACIRVVDTSQDRDGIADWNIPNYDNDNLPETEPVIAERCE